MLEENQSQILFTAREWYVIQLTLERASRQTDRLIKDKEGMEITIDSKISLGLLYLTKECYEDILGKINKTFVSGQVGNLAAELTAPEEEKKSWFRRRKR